MQYLALPGESSLPRAVVQSREMAARTFGTNTSAGLDLPTRVASEGDRRRGG